jgi:hypothetical protein
MLANLSITHSTCREAKTRVGEHDTIIFLQVQLMDGVNFAADDTKLSLYLDMVVVLAADLELLVLEDAVDHNVRGVDS